LIFFLHFIVDGDKEDASRYENIVDYPFKTLIL